MKHKKPRPFRPWIPSTTFENISQVDNQKTLQRHVMLWPCFTLCWEISKRYNSISQHISLHLEIHFAVLRGLALPLCAPPLTPKSTVGRIEGTVLICNIQKYSARLTLDTSSVGVCEWGSPTRFCSIKWGSCNYYRLYHRVRNIPFYYRTMCSCEKADNPLALKIITKEGEHIRVRIECADRNGNASAFLYGMRWSCQKNTKLDYRSCCNKFYTLARWFVTIETSVANELSSVPPVSRSKSP